MPSPTHADERRSSVVVGGAPDAAGPIAGQMSIVSQTKTVPSTPTTSPWRCGVCILIEPNACMAIDAVEHGRAISTCVTVDARSGLDVAGVPNAAATRSGRRSRA
jgi:hypothetical protein